MKSKNLVWMMALLAAVVLIGGLVWLAQDDTKSRRGAQSQQSEKKSGKERTRASKADKSARPKPNRQRMDSEHPYSPADKRLSDAIQDALEEEDLSAVVAAAEKALKSPNPDVRRDAVDALGWFGEKALAELTIWMADADEDVAQAAMDHWEEGVSELEDANERLQTSLFALNTLTDKDALTMIGGQFANAATELIDEEDDETRASQKRTEVVQVLVDMIEGGKPAHAEAAREIYEDVTGNKWISVEEAEKYLRDPDNYEEPDDE